MYAQGQSFLYVRLSVTTFNLTGELRAGKRASKPHAAAEHHNNTQHFFIVVSGRAVERKASTCWLSSQIGLSCNLPCGRSAKAEAPAAASRAVHPTVEMPLMEA